MNKQPETWAQLKARTYPSLMNTPQTVHVTSRPAPNTATSAASITYGYEK